MDLELQKAIANEVDYSPEFSARVREFRDLLEARLKAPAYLDSDMNYSASQRLSVFLDGRGEAISKGDPNVLTEVTGLISSKGPFFTLVELRHLGANRWRRQPEVSPLVGQSSAISTIRALLQENGYRELSEEASLERPVSGYVTEMDGVPATLFQVLFSEML